MSVGCTLCQKVTQVTQRGLSLQTPHILLLASPFHDRWPGSLMCVSLKHFAEMSDYYPSQAQWVLHDLLDAEKAIRRITGCTRINFVKFANVAPHLHWHVIPRYREELYLKLNPWEIQAKILEKEALYAISPDPKMLSNGLILSSERLLNALFNEMNLLQKERAQGVFGACMILRHGDPKQRAHWAEQDLQILTDAARQKPEDFESLLMLQNYGDRQWDLLGGNGDPLEFPMQIARRELKEEVGWEISQMQEVCRQWTQGLIKGFVYLTKPQQQIATWFEDKPGRIPSSEVAELKYYNLQKLAEGAFFHENIPKKIELRHRAFLQGSADFHESIELKRSF